VSQVATDSLWYRALYVFLGVCVTAFPSVTSGAEPLTIAIMAGFQGYYHIGRWLPVRVHITNPETAIDGELVLTMATQQVVTPVTLPAPSRQQWYVEVLAHERLEDVTVAVRSKGKTLATGQAKLTPLVPGQPFVVQLAGTTLEAESLSRPRDLGISGQTASLRLREFPESWKGYESVSIVMLEREALDTLQPAQLQATQQWLLLGGTLLLVDATPEKPHSPAYRHFLSPTIRELLQVSHPSTHQVPVGLGQILTGRPSSSPREASGTSSLLMAQRDGHGLTSWPLLHRIDRQILQHLPASPHESRSLILTVSAFFGVYVLTMAVLLLWVRPVRQHPGWRIVAVSGTSAIFTLSTLWLGYLGSGGRLTVQEWSIVHVFPRSVDVYITTAARVISPAPQIYHFQATSTASYIEVVREEDPAASRAYAIDPQAEPAKTEVMLPLWAKQRFLLERFVATPGFHLEPEDASDHIANRSAFALRSCFLATSDGLAALPDIPAGQTFSLPRLRHAMPTSFISLKGLPEFLERVLRRYPGMMGDNHRQVICAADGVVPSLTSTTQRAHQQGHTIVIYHLRAQEQT
jgi:hypothetical protein